MMDDSKTNQDPFSKPARARMARVLAVQAIYQAKIAEVDIEVVLAQFKQEDLAGMKGRKTDKKLFESILTFFKNYPDQVKNLLDEELSPKYTLDRLEAVLQAILLGACCEAHLKVTPPAILINEYIQITNGFFHGEESRLVNGVLDQLIQKIS